MTTIKNSSRLMKASLQEARSPKGEDGPRISRDELQRALQKDLRLDDNGRFHLSPEGRAAVAAMAKQKLSGELTFGAQDRVRQYDNVFGEALSYPALSPDTMGKLEAARTGTSIAALMGIMENDRRLSFMLPEQQLALANQLATTSTPAHELVEAAIEATV